MDVFDKGKVKFQNAYEYYDIMYNLNKYMLKASYAYSPTNFASATLYHKSISELFYFVECFLHEENLVIFYKKMLLNAIKTLELDENTARNIFGTDKKTVNDLMLFRKKDLKDISGVIDYSKQLLDSASKYKKSPQELGKRLTSAKEIMDQAKRLLYQSMKDNKLTVPINNVDASRAILGNGM